MFSYHLLHPDHMVPTPKFITTLPEEDDEYLTKNSKQFHEHLGYRLIGEFRKCGYKFGRWYHMVWMEKMIGEHPEKPEQVKRFSEI